MVTIQYNVLVNAGVSVEVNERMNLVEKSSFGVGACVDNVASNAKIGIGSETENSRIKVVEL